MEPMLIALGTGIVTFALVLKLMPRQGAAAGARPSKAAAQIAAALDDGGFLFRDRVQVSGRLSKLFFKVPGTGGLYPKLLRAGFAGSTDSFLLACIVGFLLLGALMRGGGLMGLTGALAVTILAAWWFINRRIAKRNHAFLDQFPEALDMIVRSVRSGYPLNAAVKMVADNMQPPVSTEFRQVADETNYGSPLIDALKRLSLRIDEPDIRFFVVVLSVQQEVGGNLAEVLSNLSSIIRKRKHLHMKIRALSSEGRATAWVLGLLPVFEFIAIYLVAPTHLIPLFSTFLGNMILAAAIGVVLLGVFIVRQIINMEI